MAAVAPTEAQTPPEHPQSDDRRARLVEILSTTANGCLNELGYYPGMKEQLLQYQAVNAQLRDENKKLFEDNRQLHSKNNQLFQDNAKLANMVKSQNEQLAFVQGPDSTKLDMMRDLGHQIQRLQVEQATLASRNKLLENAANVQVHENLIQQFRQLQQMYQSACNELKALRAAHGGAVNFPGYGAYAPNAIPSPPAVAGPSRQSPVDARRVSPQQLLNQQLQNMMSRPTSQSLAQGTHQRMSSGGQVSQSNSRPGSSQARVRPTPVVTIPSTAAPAAQGIPSISRQHTVQHAHSMLGPVPAGAVPIPMSEVGNAARPVGRPNQRIQPRPSPSLPTPPSSANQISPNSYAPNHSGMPLPIQQPTHAPPRAPTISIPQPNGSHPEARPDSASGSGLATPARSRSPSDFAAHISHPNRPVLSQLPTGATIPHRDGSVDAPIQVNSDTLPRPSRPSSTLDAMAEHYAKRKSVEPDSGSDLKRARVEEGDPALAPPTPRSDDEVGTGDGAGAVAVEGAGDEEDDDGDEDPRQVIVDTVFAENDKNEDELSCRLCLERHQQGHIQEAPTPFIGASVDDLVMHVETEHPAVYEHLHASAAIVEAASS